MVILRFLSRSGFSGMKEFSGVDLDCWNCGEKMEEYVSCELICKNCGLIRDCADP